MVGSETPHLCSNMSAKPRKEQNILNHEENIFPEVYRRFFHMPLHIQAHTKKGYSKKNSQTS